MTQYTVQDYMSFMVKCEPKKIVDLTKYLADPNYVPRSILDNYRELKMLSKVDKRAKEHWDKIRNKKRKRK